MEIMWSYGGFHMILQIVTGMMFVVGAAIIFPAAPEAAEPSRGANGEPMIDGRHVHCNNVRIRFDRGLPNLGAASMDSRLLILNPRLLQRETPIVQLFVFNHECGHHQVGGSELGADCWAVGRGVREGWLDAQGIGQVCRSFDDAPETSTHPSGRRRCANLDRCFAATSTEMVRERKPEKPVIVAAAAPPEVPRLVSPPRLLWSGSR